MTESQPEWIAQVRDILETLNQGVMIADECPRVVYTNSVFREMVGRNDDELVGRHVKDLFPPEDVPWLLSRIALGQLQGHDRFEFYLPHFAGGRLPVVIAARHLEDPDGRVFAIVTFTDISEQKNSEIDLRRANSLLEARERAMEEDLLLAARIQQSLAPRNLSWGAASVETYYQAARTIGGDYGLVTPGDDRLTLLLGDVSGHGIGPALVANRIYAEIISLIEAGTDLAPTFQHLNRFAMQHLEGSVMYFTMAAARLRRDGRSLEFCSAGHPPAIVLRPGQAPRLLESTSTILGCFDDAVRPESAVEVSLEAGDRVMLYTDGFTDNFNSRREMLRVQGLAEIAREASTLPLPQMKQQILDRVASWREGPAADDMSLILVEVKDERHTVERDGVIPDTNHHKFTTHRKAGKQAADRNSARSGRQDHIGASEVLQRCCYIPLFGVDLDMRPELPPVPHTGGKGRGREGLQRQTKALRPAPTGLLPRSARKRAMRASRGWKGTGR